MEPRRFNNYMHLPLEAWAADILGMEHNQHEGGPDLYHSAEGDKCCIETKWALVPNTDITDRHPKAWTVNEKQLDYPKLWGTGYWGLGLYTLDRPVSEVTQEDVDRLADLVTYQELWLVRWKWMDRYTGSVTTKGTLRYPKYKDMPNTQYTHESPKGKIHVTSYVPDAYFFPPEVEDETPF